MDDNRTNPVVLRCHLEGDDVYAAAKQSLDFQVTGSEERLATKGWVYDRKLPNSSVACSTPGCAKEHSTHLHVFRCPYFARKTEQVQYFWALACANCGSVKTPPEMKVDTKDLREFSRHDPHNPGDRPGTELVSSPEISETPGVEVSQTQETADQPPGDTAPVTNDNHSSVNDGSEDSRSTAARAAKDGESVDDTSKNTTMKNVVAVFTMTPKWLKKHPDAVKFRIAVLSKKKFDHIAEGGDIKVLLKKGFRRWVKEEGITEHKTKLAAYEAAIKKRQSLSKKKRNPVDLHLGKQDRSVYVIELKRNVIDDTTFADMNFDVLKDNPTAECVYVGETGKEISERFDDHRSADHRARTEWGQKFFLPEFDDAFREDLLVEFQETDQSISGLNTYEALKQELALRKWLQDEKGIAAYSN